jgi:hypothetical protein
MQTSSRKIPRVAMNVIILDPQTIMKFTEQNYMKEIALGQNKKAKGGLVYKHLD